VRFRFGFGQTEAKGERHLLTGAKSGWIVDTWAEPVALE